MPLAQPPQFSPELPRHVAFLLQHFGEHVNSSPEVQEKQAGVSRPTGMKKGLASVAAGGRLLRVDVRYPHSADGVHQYVRALQ